MKPTSKPLENQYWTSQIRLAPRGANNDGFYLGSPAIIALSGKLISSSDEFGTDATAGRSSIHISTDNGSTWNLSATTNNCFWARFLYFGDSSLYRLGTTQENGSVIITRSLDGGVTWSANTTILAGLYHMAPTNFVVKNSRVFAPIERVSPSTSRPIWTSVLHAPLSSDLMSASSWTTSNEILYNSVSASVGGSEFLEFNILETPSGSLNTFGRIMDFSGGNNMVRMSYDPSTNVYSFVDTIAFEPGFCKFHMLRCPITNNYICAGNHRHSNLGGNDDRTRLKLYVSKNTTTWVEALSVLDLGFLNFEQEGIHYPYITFDGTTMHMSVRTAYAGAVTSHNSNRITYWRFNNYVTLFDVL